MMRPMGRSGPLMQSMGEIKTDLAIKSSDAVTVAELFAVDQVARLVAVDPGIEVEME